MSSLSKKTINKTVTNTVSLRFPSLLGNTDSAVPVPMLEPHGHRCQHAARNHSGVDGIFINSPVSPSGIHNLVGIHQRKNRHHRFQSLR